jgi:hypothetical protein
MSSSRTRATTGADGDIVVCRGVGKLQVKVFKPSSPMLKEGPFKSGAGRPTSAATITECGRASTVEWTHPGPKRREDTNVFSNVASVEDNLTKTIFCGGQKSGRAGPKMTFGDYVVVPDSTYPGMYRVRLPDGTLTDIVNLTRARAAARFLSGEYSG